MGDMVDFGTTEIRAKWSGRDVFARIAFGAAADRAALR
jgi:hypothetical protein